MIFPMTLDILKRNGAKGPTVLFKGLGCTFL